MNDLLQTLLLTLNVLRTLGPLSGSTASVHLFKTTRYWLPNNLWTIGIPFNLVSNLIRLNCVHWYKLIIQCNYCFCFWRIVLSLISIHCYLCRLSFSLVHCVAADRFIELKCHSVFEDHRAAQFFRHISFWSTEMEILVVDGCGNCSWLSRFHVYQVELVLYSRSLGMMPVVHVLLF